MANILITGGAGFIGQAITRKLSDNPQHHITLIDNLVRGRIDTDLQEILDRPNVQFIQGDVTDMAFFDSLPTNFDYIYHLAAVIGVRNVMEKPDKVLYVNAISTLYLFEYAKRLPNLKRILFSSTSEIYAGTLKHFGIAVPTPETEHLTLDDITSPRTTYMLSKMYGESICFNYGRLYNIPFTVVRYHNVYGPRMGFLHVIPEMFLKIRDNATIDVASPAHTRAFCYIDDAVASTILVTEHDATQAEIINIGNQAQELTIRELVQTIAKVMGKSITINELPDTPGSPARRCPDTAKIKQLTGFEPQVNLEEGVTRMYAWYKDKLDTRHE
ncbi:MAG: NAD-dependent epimerase/dehydratase family protein [Candidatus Kapabacteria bacterium]|jgi:nucleoside-diphosphate-sugar epimerase|nr:NAD-dependent epimerase/dehydratase family protein [Candidatus Kapabacteria bacterium]